MLLQRRLLSASDCAVNVFTFSSHLRSNLAWSLYCLLLPYSRVLPQGSQHAQLSDVVLIALTCKRCCCWFYRQHALTTTNWYILVDWRRIEFTAVAVRCHYIYRFRCCCNNLLFFVFFFLCCCNNCFWRLLRALVHVNVRLSHLTRQQAKILTPSPPL